MSAPPASPTKQYVLPSNNCTDVPATDIPSKRKTMELTVLQRTAKRKLPRWKSNCCIKYKWVNLMVLINLLFAGMLFYVQLEFDDVMEWGIDSTFRVSRIRIIHVYLTIFGLWFLYRIISNLTILLGKAKEGKSAFLSLLMHKCPRFAQYMAIAFPDINDPYFLRYMYAIEVGESFISLVNVLTFYLCTLPIGMCIAIEVLFFMENARRVFAIFDFKSKTTRQITRSLRNTDLLVDILVEFLTISPLWYLYFGYSLFWFDAQFISLTIAPIFGINMKAHRLFREYLDDIQLIEYTKNLPLSAAIVKKVKMKRQKVESEQNKNFGVPKRKFVAVVSFLLAVAYGSMIVAQLMSHATLMFDKTYVSDPNCLLNVYTCPAVTQKQDCASWKIEGNTPDVYKIRAIPDRVMNYRLLRIVDIGISSIENIPKAVEKWVKLMQLYVHLTNVTVFEPDVRKFVDLTHFQLTYLPHPLDITGLWEHPGIHNLKIKNSKIQPIPSTVFMPSLVYLEISFSGLCLDQITSEKFPNLKQGYYSGNIASPTLFLPTLKLPGARLALAKSGLSHLNFIEDHSFVGEIIDLRANNIARVGPETKRKLLQWQSLMAGNPICNDDDLSAGMNCKERCAVTCWNPDWGEWNITWGSHNDHCPFDCFCACPNVQIPAPGCRKFEEYSILPVCRRQMSEIINADYNEYFNGTKNCKQGPTISAH